MSEPNGTPKKDPRIRHLQLWQRLMILGLAVTIILSLVVFREELFSAYYAYRSNLELNESDSEGRIHLEPDSTNIFDMIGDHLGVLNMGNYRLYSMTGEEALQTQYISSAPAMAASAYGAAIFGRGESDIVVTTTDSIVGTVTVSGTINDACMNDFGTIAVVHGDERYRNVVSVYDSQLQLVYQWQTSEYYILTAAISPDGHSLAVVAMTQDDAVFITRVVVFMLDREEYHSYCDLTDTLVTDLVFLGNSRICAVGDDRAVILDTDGQALLEYDYRGNTLSACAYDNQTCVLALLDRTSGLHSYLVSLTADKQPVERECADVYWLDVNNAYIAVLYSDSVEMMDTALCSLSETIAVRNVRKVFVTSSGKAMMIYSSEAGAVDLISPFRAG